MRAELLRARTAGLGALAALLLGFGCQGPPADGTGGTEYDETDGSLHGQIDRLIADREDGTSESFYFLKRPDGSERRLIFDNDPGLEPETRVQIWGRPESDALTVTRFQIITADPMTPTRQSALINAPKDNPRKFAFVLLDMGGGVNLSVDTARQRMFDANFFMANQGSIRRYYQEESYGVTDITGDVYGPIKMTPASTCDTKGATNLRSTVDGMAGGPSDHYLWYFGSQQGGCGWAGLASVGSPDRPSKDTWYNASAGCVVLVQEPGHNFGMQHSSSMACPGASFVDAPDGTCKHNEYGDPFDPMGGGCRHMNAWQKVFQGWLGGCNSVKVSSSATFTLFPLESACNAIQVLQIPMPKTRTFTRSGGGGATTVDTLAYYYIELRTGVGFDAGISGTNSTAPLVLVHVGGDYRPSTKTGLHTWLLDMTPGTTSVRDAAMPVGMTFNDPAGGVSFTVVSADATSASIKVDIANGAGAPTCMDGTTITAPGPASCGDGGGIVTGSGGSGGSGGSPMGGSGGHGGSGGVYGTDAGSPDSGRNDAGAPNRPEAGGGPEAGLGAGGMGGTIPVTTTGTGGHGGGKGIIPGDNSPVIGGCACAMGDTPASRAPWTLAASALAAIFLRRRRR